MTLRAYPRIQKNLKSENKFDNGEENLANILTGSTLNKKQCFLTFGVAGRKSGAKMKVDVFNGIDKVVVKDFDIVLRAPKVGDIDDDCKSNQPELTFMMPQPNGNIALLSLNA